MCTQYVCEREKQPLTSFFPIPRSVGCLLVLTWRKRERETSQFNFAGVFRSPACFAMWGEVPNLDGAFVRSPPHSDATEFQSLAGQNFILGVRLGGGEETKTLLSVQNSAHYCC